eukprot:gene15050-21126_t
MGITELLKALHACVRQQELVQCICDVFEPDADAFNPVEGPLCDMLDVVSSVALDLRFYYLVQCICDVLDLDADAFNPVEGPLCDMLDVVSSVAVDLRFQARWYGAPLVSMLFKKWPFHEAIFQRVLLSEPLSAEVEDSLPPEHVETSLGLLVEVATASASLEVDCLLLMLSHVAQVGRDLELCHSFLHLLAVRMGYFSCAAYMAAHMKVIVWRWFGGGYSLDQLARLYTLLEDSQPQNLNAGAASGSAANLPTPLLHTPCTLAPAATSTPSGAVLNSGFESEGDFEDLTTPRGHGGRLPLVAGIPSQAKGFLTQYAGPITAALVKRADASGDMGELQSLAMALDLEPAALLSEEGQVLSGPTLSHYGIDKTKDVLMAEGLDIIVAELLSAARSTCSGPVHTELASKSNAVHKGQALACAEAAIKLLGPVIVEPLVCRYMVHILLQQLHCVELQPRVCALFGLVLDGLVGPRGGKQESKRSMAFTGLSTLGDLLKPMINALSESLELNKRGGVASCTPALNEPIVRLINRLTVGLPDELQSRLTEVEILPDLPELEEAFKLQQSRLTEAEILPDLPELEEAFKLQQIRITEAEILPDLPKLEEAFKLQQRLKQGVLLPTELRTFCVNARGMSGSSRARALTGIVHMIRQRWAELYDASKSEVQTEVASCGWQLATLASELNNPEVALLAAQILSASGPVDVAQSKVLAGGSGRLGGGQLAALASALNNPEVALLAALILSAAGPVDVAQSKVLWAAAANGPKSRPVQPSSGKKASASASSAGSGALVLSLKKVLVLLAGYMMDADPSTIMAAQDTLIELLKSSEGQEALNSLGTDSNTYQHLLVGNTLSMTLQYIVTATLSAPAGVLTNDQDGSQPPVHRSSQAIDSTPGPRDGSQPPVPRLSQVSPLDFSPQSLTDPSVWSVQPAGMDLDLLRTASAAGAVGLRKALACDGLRA